MNKKRLIEIADYLRDPPQRRTFGFNMQAWKSENNDCNHDLLDDGKAENYCGTLYCIAGLAVALNRNIKCVASGYEEKATELLDITIDEAQELFHGGKNYLEDITVPQAIHAIESLVQHGEIDWQDEHL